MDEDPLQRWIYFLTFVESLEMIFSQYKETFEVILDYSKIGGGNIKEFTKQSIRNILHANIDVHNRRLIAELPGDRIKCIKKLQSHCANMNFSEKSIYDRIFQHVTHKRGEYAMNYIKRFQNAQDLSVYVGNTYSEYQLMHTFLDNFHQGGKYSSQISRHQVELRREETITDQKYLSISSLHTDYLNLDSSSGFGGNSERANTVQTKCNFCGGLNHSAEKCFKRIRQEKKLVQMVIRTTGESNTRLGNVLDVDLKINQLQNFRIKR